MTENLYLLSLKSFVSWTALWHLLMVNLTMSTNRHLITTVANCLQDRCVCGSQDHNPSTPTCSNLL